MKYIKIPAHIGVGMTLFNEEVERVYDHFQELIGGYIEQVRLGQTIHRDDVVMLVDEEGRLKSLATNSRASALYGIFKHGQPIAGDAILIGLEHNPYEGDEWTSLPEDVTLETVSEWIRDQMPKGL